MKKVFKTLGPDLFENLEDKFSLIKVCMIRSPVLFSGCKRMASSYRISRETPPRTVRVWPSSRKPCRDRRSCPAAARPTPTTRVRSKPTQSAELRAETSLYRADQGEGQCVDI